MTYAQLCREHKFNREKLREIAPLFTVYPEDANECEQYFDQMKPGTFFICKGGGLPEDSTYWLTIIRTQKKLHIFHSEILESIEVLPGIVNKRYTEKPSEDLWKKMFMDIGPENFDLNHYDYLHLVIDDFWKLVFGKTTSEMFCGGIIGAHGDKAYGYNSEWDEAGIPFERGVLLFLLTYTKELGDTPKHLSVYWVIDNYQKYLPHIEAAEKAAGLTKGEAT